MTFLIKSKEKIDSLDKLTLTMYLFHRRGREEVSLSELLECVAKSPSLFEYSFSERFLYSMDLLSDLRKLDYQGYIDRYKYRRDAFLPKNFIRLTALGKGRSRRILKQFSKETIDSLENSVLTAMKNREERWRLWSRKLR